MRRLIGCALILALAGACGRKEDPQPDPPEAEYLGDANDQIPFEEKLLPVISDGTPAGTVTVRFYEDKPSIPYISAADFQAMILPGSSMQVTMTQAGQYQLENRYGTAGASTTDERFTVSNYLAFTNVMELSQPGMDNAPYDSFPMVRYAYQLSSSPRPVTFEFAPYGIDLRGTESAVFFPFSTLADLYADLYFHYAACNKEKVVITSRDGDDFSIDIQAPEFSMQNLLTGTRAEDMAAYTYGELCFVVDYFYGMPGRSPFEASIGTMGLDKTLEASAEGKQVKNLLLSTNPLDFGAGMQYLFIYLYDGGHSKPWSGPELVLNGNLPYMTQYPELLALFSFYYYSNEILKVYRRAMVESDRFSVFADNATYHKKGDTAICHFDDFHFIDHAAWKAYYAGTGPLPTAETVSTVDRPSIFLDALKKASEDPEVKNFVLDLTLNNGGSLDLVVVLTSLMNGDTFARGYSPLTGERFQWYYDVDSNLDRTFDEKDKGGHPDLNFCILSSRFSFSCGNALPALCKDAGIMIAGETSGGGSCAVASFRTPEGYPYRISSTRARLSTKDWENIDTGITPDVAIEYGPDNSLDYNGTPVTMPSVAKFYDLDYLSALIHQYYHR